MGTAVLKGSVGWEGSMRGRRLCRALPLPLLWRAPGAAASGVSVGARCAVLPSLMLSLLPGNWSGGRTNCCWRVCVCKNMCVHIHT